MALVMEIDEPTLAGKFEALLPHLDERQRRLALAAEARMLGHGGIAVVARAAGVSRKTVAAGVDELEAGEAPLGRARRSGGGRKKVTETDPGLLDALDALVEPESRGDPMTRLRWTTRSTRNLAAELGRQGRTVSHDTVALLLAEQLHYSLQANAKTTEGRQHPDRDAQFRYINEQAGAHIGQGQPVVSVDTKKKELVGSFKNGGREWQPQGEPIPVNVHDFADKQLGKAVPYGVYDVAANIGWVSRGHRPRHRGLRRRDDPPLVEQHRQTRLPRGEPPAGLRRRRRLQRVPDPAVETGAGHPRSPDRACDHGVPPATRNQQVEQD